MKAVSRHIRHRVRYAIESMRHEGCVPAYWFKAANFGDLLTPILLRHYGLHPVHARPEYSGLSGVGSLIEHLPEDFSGVILGSGCIDAATRRAFPCATVLAVRGPLTLRQLGIEGGRVVLGDPGLLAPRLNSMRSKKTYRLGLVPHYIDRGQPAFEAVADRFRGQITTIDVRQDPEQVFRAIDECECILSSSLHGLITADTLGIPSGWLESPRVLGARHKFDDYYGSLGLNDVPSHELRGDAQLEELLALTTLKPQDRIDGIVSDLDGVFKEYAAGVLIGR